MLTFRFFAFDPVARGSRRSLLSSSRLDVPRFAEGAARSVGIPLLYFRPGRSDLVTFRDRFAANSFAVGWLGIRWLSAGLLFSLRVHIGTPVVGGQMAAPRAPRVPRGDSAGTGRGAAAGAARRFRGGGPGTPRECPAPDSHQVTHRWAIVKTEVWKSYPSGPPSSSVALLSKTKFAPRNRLSAPESSSQRS